MGRGIIPPGHLRAGQFHITRLISKQRDAVASVIGRFFLAVMGDLKAECAADDVSGDNTLAIIEINTDPVGIPLPGGNAVSGNTVIRFEAIVDQFDGSFGGDTVQIPGGRQIPTLKSQIPY